MIPVGEATEIILREARPLGTDNVPLEDALGRVLAETVIADMDLPPFDRSQMDGFAVIAADTVEVPVRLDIVGESAAGTGWHHELTSGNAVRIMTGAPVPLGADAVQKVELTSEDKGAVTIHEPVKPGRNIVVKGSEVRCGDVVQGDGVIITPRMIATLAAFGYSEVQVSRRPRVRILSTGSEIVPVDVKPGVDQIRNSNAPMLRAMAEACGVTAETSQLVHDEIEPIKTVISEAAAACDVLVITGGVSVGKYDLTKPALRELGAEIYFERVKLKPGKPTVFGRLGDVLVFGLPGNPVSAAVTFELFVRTALLAMQHASHTSPRGGKAVLSSPAKAARSRDTYLPSLLDSDDNGRLTVSPATWKGSSDLTGFSRADSLIFIPEGAERNKGDIVDFIYV